MPERSTTPLRAGTGGTRRKVVSPPPIPAPDAVLSFQVMDVSPELALRWLEGKCPNRPLNQRVVEKYARDMRHGAWHLNGETVVFDTEGALLDGQHRLWGVVTANVTVTLSVVFGASRDSMTTYDMGRARTFSDALSIEGKTHAREAAAAARWWRWYDSGRIGKPGSYTHRELKLTIDDHPLILNAAEMVVGHKAARLISKGTLAFVLAGALERDATKAEAWMDALGTGAGLSTNTATYLLRERMITDRVNIRKLEPIVVAAYTVKAWNYFLLDRPMQHLKWANNAPQRPESFPIFEDAP